MWLMTGRGVAFWLAWGLSGLSLALALLGAAMSVALPAGTLPGMLGVPDGVVFLPWVVAYSMAGAVVASRHPRNAVGWLLSLSGVLAALGNFALAYATAGLFVSHFRGLPAAHAMAWIHHWRFFAAVFLLGQLLLLLFPNGRLPSARWRPLAWVSIGVLAALTIGQAFGPGPIYLNWQRGYVLPNPFMVPALARTINSIATSAAEFEPWVLALLCALLLPGPAAVALRWRSATSEQRQQLKWFAFAGSLVVGGFVFSVVTNERWDPGWELGMLLVLFGMLGLPISVAIAVLKYRLYAIDVIINRALVYGALSLTLAATYFAGVMAFQSLLSPITQGSQLSVAGSTLVVGGIFQPARHWIQTQVDQRFYRRRYDVQRTLDAFNARLQHEVELRALREDLRRVVRDTVQPAHVSLWLRPTATSGDPAGNPPAVTQAVTSP